ncbi:hypothetical protein KDV76_18790 [Providencia stuartii]|nr:hypothetical protein [Providencia thailandensis]
MAAVHLTEMDQYFAQKRVHYVRYMDDFVLLTRTRGQLRKAIRQLNQWFASFGFRQHPDKTFIGRVSKGFDWMGAWLTHNGITGVAPRALANHRTRCRQLYEQTSRLTAKAQAERVSQYRVRWLQWVQCVLNGPTSASPSSPVFAERVSPVYKANIFINPTSGKRSHLTSRSKHLAQGY